MISNKTTKEERDRIINEALEAPEDTEPQDDVENATEVTTEPSKTPIEPEETQQEVKAVPSPDYKEKFKHSTKESQILFAKQQKFAETVDLANQLPEPSESELRGAFSTWEDMTETEKLLAKDNYMNKKKFDLVYQATQEGKEIDAWVDKVDSFLTTDAVHYSKLQGREDEFRTFALKPTRRGLDVNDLARIFLYDIEEAPATPKKGSLLETGTGGNAAKPQKEYLNEKQAAKLRTTNHKLYQKYVKEGKIKIDLD